MEAKILINLNQVISFALFYLYAKIIHYTYEIR